MAKCSIGLAPVVLAPERNKRRNRFVLKSVDFGRFGRFMTLEGTETLILTFTSKTGQPVAHNRHIVFLFGFSVREKIYLGILKA